MQKIQFPFIIIIYKKKAMSNSQNFSCPTISLPYTYPYQFPLSPPIPNHVSQNFNQVATSPETNSKNTPPNSKQMTPHLYNPYFNYSMPGIYPYNIYPSYLAGVPSPYKKPLYNSYLQDPKIKVQQIFQNVDGYSGHIIHQSIPSSQYMYNNKLNYSNPVQSRNKVKSEFYDNQTIVLHSKKALNVQKITKPNISHVSNSHSQNNNSQSILAQQQKHKLIPKVYKTRNYKYISKKKQKLMELQNQQNKSLAQIQLQIKAQLQRQQTSHKHKKISKRKLIDHLDYTSSNTQQYLPPSYSRQNRQKRIQNVDDVDNVNNVDNVYTQVMKSRPKQDRVIKIGKNCQADIPDGCENQYQYYLDLILEKKKNLLDRIINKRIVKNINQSCC